MSTADTNNIGIKLQAAGENLLTWGDPNLNNDLKVLSNMGSKWLQITINGNYDMGANVVNYATNNPDEVATIELIGGTVATAFTVTFAARPKRLNIKNSTLYAATLKLSATSGFTLPASRQTVIGTDGSTDLYNLAPNYLGTFTPTNAYDPATKSYVDTTVAAAAIPGATGTFKNSATDTTSDYASVKLTASGLIAGATVNPAGAETRDFHATGYLASASGNAYSIAATPAPTANVAFQTSYIVTFPSANTGAATLNNGLGAVALTKNGATPLVAGDIPAGATRLVVFDGTRFQVPVPLLTAHVPLQHAGAQAIGAGLALSP